MTEDNVMKIADFGLARGVHQIDYYKKTTNVSDGLQPHIFRNHFVTFQWENSVFQQLMSGVDCSQITALLFLFHS